MAPLENYSHLLSLHCCIWFETCCQSNAFKRITFCFYMLGTCQLVLLQLVSAGPACLKFPGNVSSADSQDDEKGSDLSEKVTLRSFFLFFLFFKFIQMDVQKYRTIVCMQTLFCSVGGENGGKRKAETKAVQSESCSRERVWYGS